MIARVSKGPAISMVQRQTQSKRKTFPKRMQRKGFWLHAPFTLIVQGIYTLHQVSTFLTSPSRRRYDIRSMSFYLTASKSSLVVEKVAGFHRACPSANSG